MSFLAPQVNDLVSPGVLQFLTLLRTERSYLMANTFSQSTFKLSSQSVVDFH